MSTKHSDDTEHDQAQPGSTIEPQMTWPDACDRLSGFYVELPDAPDAEDVKAALEQHPDALDAAIAVLVHAFAPVAASDFDPGSAQNPSWFALAVGLLQLSPAYGERFIDEVMFNVRHPGLYRLLAPLIHQLLSPAAVEEAIVRHLRGGDDFRCANALAIQYHLYGRMSDPPLSEAGATAIGEAVAALRRNPRASAALARELASYEPPLNPVGRG